MEKANIGESFHYIATFHLCHKKKNSIEIHVYFFFYLKAGKKTVKQLKKYKEETKKKLEETSIESEQVRPVT